jgi:hypothetical protein
MNFRCLLAIATLAAMSCGSNESNQQPCGPCASPGVDISVYSTGAAIRTLTISGAACENTSISSFFVPDPASGGVTAGFAPGAQSYSISIAHAAEGECEVQVELEDGRQLQRSFTVTRNTGCCETYSVGNPTWDADASADAG